MATKNKATKKREPMPKAKATPVEKYQVAPKDSSGHAVQLSMLWIGNAKSILADVDALIKKMARKQGTLLPGPERDTMGRIAGYFAEKRNALKMRLEYVLKSQLPAAHDAEWVLNATKELETLVDLYNYDSENNKAVISASKVIVK